MPAYNREIYGEPFLAAHLHNQESINLAENDGEIWERSRLTARTPNKCSKYSCGREPECSLQRRMEIAYKGRYEYLHGHWLAVGNLSISRIERQL